MEYEISQSGVIPYRRTEKGIEVLLITSRRKKNWIVPKGYNEFNLSGFESGKKEALEEAGVLGANETVELGSYTVEKKFTKKTVKLYSMEVIEVHEDFPEKNDRKRRWMSIDEAVNAVKIPELAEMIRSLPGRVNGAIH